MALPDDIPRFGRVAEERFEDARALFESGRTTGSVYVVGYAVECTLKSILMKIVPEREAKDVYGRFRQKGHDIGWLKEQLVGRKVEIPDAVQDSLEIFTAEFLGYRYTHEEIGGDRAGEILSFAGSILEWGRLVETQIDNLNEMAGLVADHLNRRYKAAHPDARIDAYAIPSNVRVRVIDPAFEGKRLKERQEIVSESLGDLPRPVRSAITMLLLLTPEERDLSWLSLEFDDPSRSLL